MKKYWNALRYGNAKTKRILVSAILLIFLVGFGTIRAFFANSAVWGLIAIFAAIMVIVLLQSVRFGNVEYVDRKMSQKEKNNAIREKRFEKLSDFTEDDLKQLLVSYHVNASHVQVMIDSYAREGVKQTPAYLWKEKGYLNLLVLETKPRNLAVPLSQVTEITYRQNVEVNPLAEYEQMRTPSVVNAMYQEYMPVYKERQAGVRKYYTKNLYVLAPGIAITNTSVKNVRRMLSVPISFRGIIDERYSKYYQEAYRMKILLMDQVLAAEEYKEQVSRMLKQMSDSGMQEQEFYDDLALMVRARLVTKEVAEYFIEYRRKKSKAQKKQKSG